MQEGAREGGRTRTGTRRTNEDRTELLRWRLGPSHSALFSLLERTNLFVQLRDEALEILELAGRSHGVSVYVGDGKREENWAREGGQRHRRATLAWEA